MGSPSIHPWDQVLPASLAEVSQHDGQVVDIDPTIPVGVAGNGRRRRIQARAVLPSWT